MSLFQAKILSDVGGIVLANACGPCIGQWDRYEVCLEKISTTTCRIATGFCRCIQKIQQKIDVC